MAAQDRSGKRLPNFTLVQLRYFAAAAEHGSMTAAARELVVSQSAVSTAVAQLEKELGVQLLLRHHARGLALTPAGREFYTELRGFLAHSQELADAARNAGQMLMGELRVGMFATIAPFMLPRLVTEYADRYPRVDLTVIEAEHADLKKGLRDGAFEVAVMYSYDLGTELRAVPVATIPPYVLVPVGHHLAGRRSVSLTELADDRLVLLDLPYTATYFRSLFAQVGVEPTIGYRSRLFETVRSMVAAGHGYSILNQRPASDESYSGGPVVALEIKDELPTLDAVAAWVDGTRLTRKATAFIEQCQAIGGLEPVGIGKTDG
ncbi:LysR family transcriptional regulator [Branchiibius sp. NY16-3462-2]|uniref:LysR family transcriptional regulator n=1 Tax=Branchiibius sp. NY16-3462-2 TaxID=1807500 RepID=UPI000A42ACD3|nr:LysR family transcriptional regulator [Branchiibius sp. NY16-3462-2]